LARYLLIRLSSLGDVLFALAAVDRLREAEPAAEISFLVEDRFAELPRAHPGIDEVLVVPRREGLAAIARARRSLAARRFDAVLDLQGNAKSALQLTAIRHARKIGFGPGSGRDANFLFVGERVTPPPAAVHRVDRFLWLLSKLGIEPRRAAPARLRIPEEAAARAAAALGAAGGRPKVVMHPATSSFGLLKRWEPERFGRAAKQLGIAPGAATFLTCAPGEEPLAAAAAEAACGAAAVAPVTTILELAAWLAAPDLVVAADTGPLHLANRLGTPVVALFGPKDPARYGPAYDPNYIVRRADVPCSPCARRWCEAPACMAGIAVEEVAFAARRMLTAARGSPPSRDR
jgi:lipopolysaccharide heptosyltransferase I